jgi:hypothetical protein
MAKVKITPSAVVLKSFAIYLLEENQRPNLKKMDKRDLINFIEETGMLGKVFRENNILCTKTMAFCLKMLLAHFNEKVETDVIENKISIFKNGVVIGRYNKSDFDLSSPLHMSFDVICKAGSILNTINSLNLSDKEVSKDTQTSIAV